VNPFPLSGIGRGAVVNRGRFMVCWCRCVVYRGRLVVDRLWFMVNWLRFMVDRFRFMVDRFRFMVDRFWFMVCRRWRMIGLLLWIVGSSLIGHLSLISIVVVSSVLDVLDAAIRKLDGVGSAHYIAIRRLSSPEVCLAVIISHSILISVGLRGVFFLMVNRFWLMVDWFWFMVDRLWCMVDRFWCMVDRFWFVVDRLRCMVGRLRRGIGRFWRGVDRLWNMVGGGGGVVDRRWGRVIHWSRGMVGGGGMNSGVVHWDIVVAEAGVTV